MANTHSYVKQISQHCARDTFCHPVEELALEDALGYTLADGVSANVPAPRFSDSQMDGYAISEQAAAELAKGGEGAEFVIGPELAAGADPAQVLADGAIPDSLADHGEGGDLPVAIPIMTGARVPANAGAVIPVEQCEPARFGVQGERVRIASVTPGSFIRQAGSDIAAGEEIAPAGAEITPSVLAALAYQGFTAVLVNRRPRALLCVGGAEIGGSGPASIPDVNGPLLRALCETYRIDVPATVATNDDPEALASDLQAAITRHRPDVIITAGGISQGKHEVIRTLLEDNKAHDDAASGGHEAWFGHVAQQPGGPQGHGHLHGVPVICLPGNPISVLVSFRLFVAPALAPELTASPAKAERTALLSEAAEGLADGRDQYRRGIHRVSADGTVHAEILGGASSHLLAQGAQATCLIRIPAAEKVEAGQPVTIFPL